MQEQCQPGGVADHRVGWLRVVYVSVVEGWVVSSGGEALSAMLGAATELAVLMHVRRPTDSTDSLLPAQATTPFMPAGMMPVVHAPSFEDLA